MLFLIVDKNRSPTPHPAYLTFIGCIRCIGGRFARVFTLMHDTNKNTVIVDIVFAGERCLVPS